MQAEQVEQLIQAQLPEAQVKVEGADGQHFEAIVVTEAFVDKSRIQRHRMVYSALGDLISSGTLHALSLRTLTPAEQEAKQ